MALGLKKYMILLERSIDNSGWERKGKNVVVVRKWNVGWFPFSDKEEKVHFSFISALNCSHVWIWFDNNKGFFIIRFWTCCNDNQAIVFMNITENTSHRKMQLFDVLDCYRSNTFESSFCLLILQN